MCAAEGVLECFAVHTDLGGHEQRPSASPEVEAHAPAACPKATHHAGAFPSLRVLFGVGGDAAEAHA